MDIVQFDPTGGFSGDARPANPNCDRLSEDVEFLYNVFSRHQFDDEEGPIVFPSGATVGTSRENDRFRIENNNVAPRLAVAWDPLGNGKSRVFATWGRYFGTLHLNAVSSEAIADTRTFVYDPNDIPFGDSAQPISVSRFSTYTVDRDLKTPYTDELVVGAEYRIAGDWSISLRYIQRDARDQLQDVDRNHFVRDADGDGKPDDNFGAVVPSGFGGYYRAPDGLPDLFVRNPLFNQVLELGNVNSSDFHSWQFVVNRRLGKLWQMNASYTYSKVTGEADAYDALAGNDPGVPMDDVQVLEFDQTHAVKITGMGFLPHGQTFGGSIRWSSGLPYSVVERQFSYDDWDNPSIRTSYPEGPRNSVRNEGVWTVDLSYRKWFDLQVLDAGLGVEVFNVLNSDDLILTTVDRGAVGSEFERRFGRRWQLGLELHF